MRILHNQDTVAPQASESLPATKFSELSKYQSVKSSGNMTSGYMSYTKKQIQLVQKLKSMEHCQGARHAQDREKMKNKILLEEKRKMRQYARMQSHDHTANVGGKQINLISSLP